MYEKEEQKLNDFKDRLEQVPLPLEAADGAIMQGLERAKREKMQKRMTRKRTLWSLAAVALLVLTLATTIRVSPAFANAVASIPGMERFVNLLQYDKGLEAVFENDYYQPIGESQTVGNATLTVDGVILDESGMNIFYTIESAVDMDDIIINPLDLENQQQIPPGGISWHHSDFEEGSPKIFKDVLSYKFLESTKFENLDFILPMEFILNGESFNFSIPFTVPENVEPSITYDVQEQVEVEGQKFTVEEVTVHPLRVGIRISFDPDNTKKILQFEDIRLEDENGETWVTIMNGTSASGDINDGEIIYYLQSNYFEAPEELYLRINKMQAVDIEDSYFLVDTDKNLLVHSPRDERLELVKSSRTEIEMTLKIDASPDRTYSIDSKVTDANGELLELRSSGNTSGYEGKQDLSISIKDNGYANPIRVDLFAYPNYISGDVKIELKK